MKQTPEEKLIENNMQPGTISAEGFLGEDTRDLTSIMRADRMNVAQLGLTHQMIADRLRQLTEAGKGGLGSPVQVGDLEITVEDFRGRIFCPFRDRLSFGKRVTTCKHKKTGKVLRWSDLNIHMIEAHGFYEGYGSRFRINPAAVQTICFH